MRRIVQKCYAEIVKGMIHSIDGGFGWTTVCVQTDCGFINITTNKFDNKDIRIGSYIPKKREYPNLCKEIADKIPSWHNVAIARVKYIMENNSIEWSEVLWG